MSETTNTRNRPPRKDMFYIELDQLMEEDNFNVRYDLGDITELAQSIHENGIKRPMHVEKVQGLDTYIIRDGHRRFEAAKYARTYLGWDGKVPVLTESKNITDIERCLNLVIYNDGKPLTVLEQAYVYRRLYDAGMSATGIAEKVGKSNVHIADCIMLSQAPESLLDEIKAGTVSASLAIEQLKKDQGATLTEILAKRDNKKVTKKALPAVKARTFTVDDLESLYEEMEEAEFNGDTTLNEAKMDTIKNVAKFYRGHMELQELLQFLSED